MYHSGVNSTETPSGWLHVQSGVCYDEEAIFKPGTCYLDVGVCGEQLCSTAVAEQCLLCLEKTNGTMLLIKVWQH